MLALKVYLRQRLVSCPRCYALYIRMKYKISGWRELLYYLSDLRIARQHMHWGDEAKMSPDQLKAKLLFYYHKIEKGLCMPGERRLFGVDVVPHVTGLLEAWESQGQSLGDPVYRGALDSLRAYRERIVNGGLDPDGKVAPCVDSFLESRVVDSQEEISTPLRLNKQAIESVPMYGSFRALCEIRRSYRVFCDSPVENDELIRAVEVAQLSPSACNRQPCSVRVIRDSLLKRDLLSLQNGNAGFGHLAAAVLVVTADARSFFGAIERNQPYVDGGLFSMSLLYGLQVQGLVSCCLNWCVTPDTDRKAHDLLEMSSAERIIMLIAVGRPVSDAIVPRSHRKALDSIVTFR
ncbi:MAG: hypothetical protein FHP92_01520 [Denitromonas halophila]|nr:MAG: hypothetical protein FHP92_01520 [Denitromonas halophila]